MQEEILLILCKVKMPVRIEGCRVNVQSINIIIKKNALPVAHQNYSTSKSVIRLGGQAAPNDHSSNTARLKKITTQKPLFFHSQYFRFQQLANQPQLYMTSGKIFILFLSLSKCPMVNLGGLKFLNFLQVFIEVTKLFLSKQYLPYLSFF